MIVANTITGITSTVQNGSVRLIQKRYTTVLMKGRNMTKNEVIRGLLEIITADRTPEKHKKVLAEAVVLLSEEKEKEKEYIPTVIPTPYYPTPYYQTTCPTWDKVTITCDASDLNLRTTL